MGTFTNSEDQDEMAHNAGISSGSVLFVKEDKRAKWP